MTEQTIFSSDMTAVVNHTIRKISYLLQIQCTDRKNRNYGGFIMDNTAYADSRNSIYEGMNLIAGYLNEDIVGKFNQDFLFSRIEMFLTFMKTRQRENGIVMLGASATASCSEIGFTIPAVCYAIEQLQKADYMPGREVILCTLTGYLHKGANALRSLPPLTSNHRWTACTGPLALVNRLFPDPANYKIISKYLSDGIDIDADGLYYEERSPNYNMVANMGLIYLADALGKREYLEMAARNARFQLRLLQPSNEVDTSFSYRQDRGVPRIYNFGCFYIYRRLAQEFSDGEFHTAADILRDMIDERTTPLVPYLLLMNTLKKSKLTQSKEKIKDCFDIKLETAPIWRWRNSETAMTVCADAGRHWWDHTYNGWGAPSRSNNLFTYHYQDAIIDGFKILWGSGSGNLRPEIICYPNSRSAVLEAKDYGTDHLSHYRPKPERFHIDFAMSGCITIYRNDDDSVDVHCIISGEKDCPVNIRFLLRNTCRIRHLATDEAAESIEQSFFTAGGCYEILSPSGARLKISGLPTSEHRLSLNDSHAITGIAEKECIALNVGLFTPVDICLHLIPTTRNDELSIHRKTL